MMKSWFHLIEYLVSMDKFTLLTEILFFKTSLISNHSGGERNTWNLLCMHKIWKKSFDEILISS